MGGAMDPSAGLPEGGQVIPEMGNRASRRNAKKNNKAGKSAARGFG